ncbi:uncharacterized protein DSM5745_00746 [Aspergillus mulundensis]|uniref:Uncharacterized protein n=1 Tax=Aspergillus mulundensis TaxID=1810919 RepID=A0A3D8T4I7_9EURO|nr:hypothetical protein DSM5745_00746 [Aspergillus mulundensis]RDW93424.1 hypothetical protein DSM5745_00746 [Aspergillus mulundensis]
MKRAAAESPMPESRAPKRADTAAVSTKSDSEYNIQETSRNGREDASPPMPTSQFTNAFQIDNGTFEMCLAPVPSTQHSNSSQTSEDQSPISWGMSEGAVTARESPESTPPISWSVSPVLQQPESTPPNRSPQHSISSKFQADWNTCMMSNLGEIRKLEDELTQTKALLADSVAETARLKDTFQAAVNHAVKLQSSLDAETAENKRYVWQIEQLTGDNRKMQEELKRFSEIAESLKQWKQNGILDALTQHGSEE